MNTMDHDALREAAGLYVLGALPADEGRQFEAHVSDCAECQREVRSLGAVVNLLPFGLPQIEPPLALRGRVLAATRADTGVSGAPPTLIRRRDFSRTVAWLGAAALLVFAAGLGAYTVSLRQRLATVEGQLREAVDRLNRGELLLASAEREADRAQVRLAVLMAPDMKQVTLAGQPPAPRAAGRAFFSASTGLVFAAANLPTLPPGRTYQLWFLTRSAPVSAGLINPDPGGRVTAAFDVPPAATGAAGLAVSIEPDGGVPAPTGAIYLAGTSR